MLESLKKLLSSIEIPLVLVLLLIAVFDLKLLVATVLICFFLDWFLGWPLKTRLVEWIGKLKGK